MNKKENAQERLGRAVGGQEKRKEDRICARATTWRRAEAGGDMAVSDDESALSRLLASQACVRMIAPALSANRGKAAKHSGPPLWVILEWIWVGMEDT
jgi:hypothetical protein